VARSVLPAVLLVATSAALWRRRNDPFTRVLVAVSGLLVLAFLGAAAYWNQYNAHLAFPLAMLVGVGLGEAARRLPSWQTQPAFGLVAGVLVAIPGFVWVIDRRRDADAEQAARVAVLRKEPPAQLCAFEPHELVMADRWPAKLDGTMALVDSYGQMHARRRPICLGRSGLSGRSGAANGACSAGRVPEVGARVARPLATQRGEPGLAASRACRRPVVSTLSVATALRTRRAGTGRG
jgi:hypothetical protein